MEANNKFWEVTVELSEEQENGKVKKRKENSLVDAADVTEVEQKVLKEYGEYMTDFEIKSIRLSKIVFVY